MKNFKQKRSRYIWKSVLLPAIILGALIFILVFGVSRFSMINDEQSRILTEQSLKKAVIQCYANEGRYPADITYLEENYYLVIDTDKYFVYYDCWADNVMPDIAVYSRNQ